MRFISRSIYVMCIAILTVQVIIAQSDTIPIGKTVQGEITAT